MGRSSTEWTLEGFVEHFDFVHKKMPDHKYVWVLGAGASLASGIPLGSTLVDHWLSELHKRECKEKMPLENWATASTLDIKGFKFDERASFYSKIYTRRFSEYPDEGYAYLEDMMSGKDPSPGYSILAAALAEDPPRHNAVITTNFDNLVADALSIYTDTFPFVCGHESLTGFVRVAMRRPLICKIHRDLLLGPQNDTRSLIRLRDEWGKALRSLFEHYTPLFIGYGGNDDTLMDLLESLELGDIKGQMIWCYYEGGKPSERIANMVTDHKGKLVPVPDFDLLMVLLGEKMGISLLDEEIGTRANIRTERYRTRIQRLDTVEHPEVTKALAATLDRSGGWWAWEQKASLEKTNRRREIVYRQGLQHYPKNASLRYTFGHFLTHQCGKYDEAEQQYRKGLELDPNNDALNSSLAYLLWIIRGNHSEAEKHYLKALNLDSDDIDYNSNYTAFLLSEGRHDEATKRLEFTKSLAIKNNSQTKAEIALYDAILTKANGLDDTQLLADIRALLLQGFDRGYWDFDKVLTHTKTILSHQEFSIYSAIAKAILDADKVSKAITLLDKRLAADPPMVESKASIAKPKRKKKKKTISKKKTASKITRKKTPAKVSDKD